jgi:hypothetical protein
MVRAAVSVFGRAYLGVSLVLFLLGVAWVSLLLQENARWEELTVFVPRLDFAAPIARARYEFRLGALAAGWGLAFAVLALVAIRLPFRVRAAARVQRRIRELEREVHELRTLPLRQREEDEVLAAEAHLDARPKNVMTQKIELRADGTRTPDGASP